MLAIIIGFLSVFATHPDLTPEPQQIAYDSVKRPGKTKISTDTTGRFVEINRIFIIGNRITRDQIILLEFDESDTLSWVLSQNEDRTYALEVRKRHAF